MSTMKQRNPLTESFLVQLDVDLESLGVRDPKFKSFKYGFSNVCDLLFIPEMALVIKTPVMAEANV